VVEEVMILSPGGDVAVGVGESEPELQFDEPERCLGLEAVLSGGGVGACDGEEKEVKNESVEKDEEVESLLVSLTGIASFPSPSILSSSSPCTTMAATFFSFISLVVVRDDPVCVLATIGAVAAEQLKLITLPFPPTFRPLPTMSSGIVAPMAGTTFRWEGFVAIVIVLPVALRPGDIAVGPMPRAVPRLRLSGLALGGDEGANGREGRFFMPIGGLLGLGEEDTGTLGALADRSVHPLTLSLTLIPNASFVEAELALRSRKASKLCCTLRCSVFTSF
jgi:hypothetical protein